MNSRLRHFALLTVVCLTAAGCSEPTDSASPDPPDGSVDAAVSSDANQDVPDESSLKFSFVAPLLSEQELQQGWISLFDGTSLFGWDVPATGNWHVEDGCVVADDGERSLLMTRFRLDDFEFRCDFHLASGGNSGVFLRTSESPADPARDTYELNICDSHPTHGTGSLVGRHVAANVPPVEGEWHTFFVRCAGNRIEVRLDDNDIVDFTDSTDALRTSGRLGLQYNSGRIAFRNVFLRLINEQELFDGQSLSGWSVVPGATSEFAARDGGIHATNGPGFLQSDAQFADFALHVEARTNGDALNSGVFFRALPGTQAAPSNGYEMQIHNGFRNDDRRQPADFGTGAIFRRVPARYIVAKDREWMFLTLIAQGDRMATWVNGFQVVDWQDQRPPHENPRQGRRVEAGHLLLQGHDPATDLQFRAIRIHELPLRP